MRSPNYISFGNISSMFSLCENVRLYLFIDNQNVLLFMVEIDLSILNFSLSTCAQSLFLMFKNSDLAQLCFYKN